MFICGGGVFCYVVVVLHVCTRWWYIFCCVVMVLSVHIGRWYFKL